MCIHTFFLKWHGVCGILKSYSCAEIARDNALITQQEVVSEETGTRFMQLSVTSVNVTSSA